MLSHFFDLVPVELVHVFILKFFNRLNNLVEQKLNFLCQFSLEVGSVAILLSKVTRVDQDKLQLPIEVCHQLLSKLDLLIQVVIIYLVYQQIHNALEFKHFIKQVFDGLVNADVCHSVHRRLRVHVNLF